MHRKLEIDECKQYFGIEYVDLKKLQQHAKKLKADHSIPNELYCQICNLEMGLESVFKLFN